MLILFEAWKYTDEYYHLIETGVKSEDDDCDYSKDCYLDKVLLNPKLIISAIPSEKKYTLINEGQRSYLLNISFTDFCQITGFTTAKQAKSKWAN